MLIYGIFLLLYQGFYLFSKDFINLFLVKKVQKAKRSSKEIREIKENLKKKEVKLNTKLDCSFKKFIKIKKSFSKKYRIYSEKKKS